MGIMGNFADGLKDFFTRGSLYKRTYLTKRGKEILRIMIDETLDHTIDIEDEDEYNRIMEAMNYLNHKIGYHTTLFVPQLNRDIAKGLHYWLADNKYHYLSNEKDFDKATQFVCNLYCKQYSVAEFVD